MHLTITRQLKTAFIASAAAILLMSLAACGKSHKASPEDHQAARDRARSQAVELASKTDTMQMENILIEVRERETYLRTHGHDDVADTYIDTFLEVLDSVSPAISAQLR